MTNDGNKLYALKIARTDGKNRYVQWCTDTWYGTTADPSSRFTQIEAYRVANQIKNHYIPKLDIVSEDGEVEHLNFLWRARHKIARDDNPPKKKNISMMVIRKAMFKPL